MSKKLYEVKLGQSERDYLIDLTTKGEEKARKLTRARILLKADEKWTDQEISLALDVGTATVERVRKRYSESGLEVALNGKASTRVYSRLIDGHNEAFLIALVCGNPPEGYAGWTLRLLAEELVKLEEVELESISYETVRQVLKKTNLSLG